MGSNPNEGIKYSGEPKMIMIGQTKYLLSTAYYFTKSFDSDLTLHAKRSIILIRCFILSCISIMM